MTKRKNRKDKKMIDQYGLDYYAEYKWKLEKLEGWELILLDKYEIPYEFKFHNLSASHKAAILSIIFIRELIKRNYVIVQYDPFKEDVIIRLTELGNNNKDDINRINEMMLGGIALRGFNK